MHLSFKFSKKSREKAVPIPYHSSIQILPSSVSTSKSFKSDFNLSLDQGVAFFSVLWTISKEESECLIRALITEKKKTYIYIYMYLVTILLASHVNLKYHMQHFTKCDRLPVPIIYIFGVSSLFYDPPRITFTPFSHFYLKRK